MVKWIRAVAAAGFLGIALPAFAQQTSLDVRVVDPQAGAIAGAAIRLTSVDGAPAGQGVSDAAGTLRFEAVPAGTLILEVAKHGFRTYTGIVTPGEPGGGSVTVSLTIAGIDDVVVVTAAGRPQVAHEVSKPVTVIDAQEILARNETALAEIVRFAPGVQVRNSGGPGQNTSMRIRGLRSDAAAVLIDGLRFRDASTTQGDVSSFLQTLNFVDADRVEVMRGSGSSLYGTNAVGGVVNVVTRPGGGPLHVEGQTEGGSLGTYRTRGSAGGGALDNRLRYSVGLMQLNVLDGVDGNDAARSTGGHGMVEYNASPTATLTLRMFGSDDSVETNASPTASGIPESNVPDTTIVDALAPSLDQLARANAGQSFDVGRATFLPGLDDPDAVRDSAFLATALVFRHSGWSPLRWQASYQRVHTTRQYVNDTAGPGFQPAGRSASRYRGTIDTVDVRGYASPLTWLDVTAGYELEREGYFDGQDDGLAEPFRTQTETRIHQTSNAVYGAAQMALVDRRLQVAVSGRLQGFSLSTPEFHARGTTSPYDGVALPDPPRATTGDVSLAYAIAGSSTKLRVHAGNAYRAPALYERFGGGFFSDPVSGQIVFSAYGDPRLRPDRYRTVDGGIDQYFLADRLFISATAFYNDVYSLTAFDTAGVVRPETDPYGRSGGYINGRGGFSRGVELGVEARPSTRLRVSASYTYTQSETDEDISVPDFYVVPNVFRHTATLIVTRRWDRVDATLDVFHGSGSYGAFFAAGRTRAYAFPAVTTAAIVAGYRLVDRDRWPIRAYVKVDNMFDETYYDGGWRNPGRTAVVGVSLGY